MYSYRQGVLILFLKLIYENRPLNEKIPVYGGLVVFCCKIDSRPPSVRFWGVVGQGLHMGEGGK